MKFFTTPVLTKRRRWAVLAVAALADGLQWAVGPLGWVGVVQVIDVVAAIATILLIGFHPLLLPTFILEAVPVAGLLPTWTGCVMLVLTLRGKETTGQPLQPVASPPPAVPPKLPPPRA